MPIPSTLNRTLDRIRVVLVEPAGPRNVGSVARVMKNFGLRRLSVIGGAPLDLPDCCAMAASAIDVLHRAETPPSFSAAIAARGLVVGTTARTRHRAVVRSPSEAAREILNAARLNDVALVFGREDDGLRADELKRCQMVVSIGTSPAYRSLNLAQAVGVIAYEIFTASGAPQANAQGRIGRLLDAEWRERLEEDLFAAIESAGLVNEKTRRDYRASLNRVLNSGPLQTRDVRVLFALAKRVRAIRNWTEVSHPGARRAPP